VEVGVKVTGWPTMTLSRGELVYAENRPQGAPGRGKFLKCALPDPARPKQR
jgi:dihydropyrimidinase